MTVCRWFLREELPKGAASGFPERVSLRAFRPLRPDEEADERHGWCGFGAPGQLDVGPQVLTDGDYLALGFRHDRYRFPPAILGAEVERVARAAGKPLDKVSRAQLRQLKESARRQLRQRILPSLSYCDVVWNLRRGEVNAWTQNRATRDKIVELFELTFGLELDSDSPYFAARRLVSSQAKRKRLDQLEMSVFHPSGAAGEAQAETSQKRA